MKKALYILAVAVLGIFAFILLIGSLDNMDTIKRIGEDEDESETDRSEEH